MSPLSGVLGEAWGLYRRHAAHFIMISFAIYLAVAIITALLSLAAGSWGAFIGLLFSLFGMFLLQAALVNAVQDGRADLHLGGPCGRRCRTWGRWRSPRSSPASGSPSGWR